jgi:cytochrome P450
MFTQSDTLPTALREARVRQFPVGAAVTLAELEQDPYPVYERLRASEPVSWIDTLGMWYVTRYEDVRAIVMDSDRFTTAFDNSLIVDTFGAHMLTTEGADHDRYRRAVQPRFVPGHVRQQYEPPILQATQQLIDGFADRGQIELRAAFAARLPVQTILAVFGMPLAAESSMRRWYDIFERALANYTWDAAIRQEAHGSVAEFHSFLDEAIRTARGGGEHTLLAALVNAPLAQRLTDEEIRRNMSIIFFGGISTVEALILNSLWALFEHPQILERVRSEPRLIPKAIEEALRWLSPAQSATRHITRDTAYGGVELRAGEVINCMLGAANRDTAMFSEPHRYDIDRANAQRHLAFATGVHTCLGFHLAKAQGRIALEQLLARLPQLRLVREQSAPPRGHEFRQPRALCVAWDT